MSIFCDDCCKPVGLGDDNWTKDGGALCRFCKHRRCVENGREIAARYNSDDSAENIQDALTDLLHFAVFEGVDFDSEIATAKMHLEHEIE